LLTSLSLKILCINEVDNEIIQSYFKWVNQPIYINDDVITYDIDFIKNNIKGKILDDETIEAIANFVNLFSDFVYQDKRNFHLKRYIEDENINQLWRYYYDYIFFPRFNKVEIKKTFLDIDYKQLEDRFKQLITTFEKYFELIECK